MDDSTILNSSEVEAGVADYYNRMPVKAASRLVARVPDVLILARCEGAPETALYFTERFGVEVTEKMIRTIKGKVRKKTLHVTHEELLAAANSHSISAARLLREPSIADPAYYNGDMESKQPPITQPSKKKTAEEKKTERKKIEPPITPIPDPEKTVDLGTGSSEKNGISPDPTVAKNPEKELAPAIPAPEPLAPAAPVESAPVKKPAPAPAPTPVATSNATAAQPTPSAPLTGASAFADPKAPTAEELRALSRKAEEDSRKPPKPKPIPPTRPKFNGPPLPANGSKATPEENNEFRVLNLAAKEKYIAQIEADPNWKMKDSWKGNGDPDDYVEYIGPPWE